MFYAVDLSGESPTLIGEPVQTLPKEVRGLSQASLDNLSTALTPCSSPLVDRAYWPVIIGSSTPLEGWQDFSSSFSVELDASNKRVILTYLSASKPVIALKASLVEKINKEARARILALVPSWTQENHAEKQRNAIARSVQLLRKIVDETASSEELAEADAIEALWDGVAAIRAASNVAASAISAAQTSEAAYNAAEAVEWPS